MDFKRIILALVIRVVIGIICRMIVRKKGYPDAVNHGFAWGFWLDIIGLIVCLCKSRYYRPQMHVPSGYSYTAPTRPTYPSPSRPANNKQQVSRVITKANFREKMNTLDNSQDVRVQPSQEQKNLVTKTRKYYSNKRRSYTTKKAGETIDLDLSWTENLSELLEKTEVVYSIAEMNCNKRLASERFEYYINLHYRSFTAADLCHAKREEILPFEKQIRKTVARLNDRNDSLRVDQETYNQLVTLRNTTGDICVFLKKRRDQLNHQTGIIRDKIRDECGEKGRNWYQNLMERAGK